MKSGPRPSFALGDGLFLSEGEQWRAQRKIAQPAFHRQRLAGMAAAMVDATDAMLERWEQVAERSGEFDLSAETSRLALDVIGRTLLDDDLGNEAEDLGRAMVGVFRYFNHAMNHFLIAPRFIRPRAIALWPAGFVEWTTW